MSKIKQPHEETAVTNPLRLPNNRFTRSNTCFIAITPQKYFKIKRPPKRSQLIFFIHML
nr:MAG TPA: hypothetical protein [Caudoviricetes sp.]